MNKKKVYDYKDYPEEDVKELEEAVKKIWETGKVEW